MSKRRKILICVVSAILAFVFIFQLTSQREPVYRGRTLSQWFWQLPPLARGKFGRASGSPGIFESREAVRQIGTNALPLLLDWIRRDPAPMRQELTTMVAKLPARIATSSWLSGLAMTGDDRAIAALNGFMILGPNAAPAIPELALLARESGRHKASRDAMYVLVRIGPEAIPTLSALLADPNVRLDQKLTILASISSFGTNAIPAIPAIIQCLKDQETAVRQAAILALAELRLEPGLVVPALATCLNDPNRSIRQRAIDALEKFGTEVGSSVRSLIDARGERATGLRVRAINSLGETNATTQTNAPDMSRQPMRVATNNTPHIRGNP